MDMDREAERKEKSTSVAPHFRCLTQDQHPGKFISLPSKRVRKNSTCLVDWLSALVLGRWWITWLAACWLSACLVGWLAVVSALFSTGELVIWQSDCLAVWPNLRFPRGETHRMQTQSQTQTHISLFLLYYILQVPEKQLCWQYNHTKKSNQQTEQHEVATFALHSSIFFF